MADDPRTVVSESRYEIEPIKGSRFVATVAPAPTRADAEVFVARIRTEFPRATHNCWAFRTGRAGEIFQSGDDGEPTGSAGRPILQQIDGHRLTRTAVVVTRWFGGTKLGVGGLMRAYGGAAGRALDRALVRTEVVTRRLQVEYPYACSGAVEALLAARGLEPREAQYGVRVRFVIEVPEREAPGFTQELADRTAGRAVVCTRE